MNFDKKLEFVGLVSEALVVLVVVVLHLEYMISYLYLIILSCPPGSAGVFNTKKLL